MSNVPWTFQFSGHFVYSTVLICSLLTVNLFNKSPNRCRPWNLTKKNQYSASSVAQISPNCFIFLTTLRTVYGRSLASVFEPPFWNPFGPKSTLRAVTTFYQLVFQICGRGHQFPPGAYAYYSA